ncbi:hypothetical protein CLV98_104323 [Dyadobacter jejuensis]|uniref:DUF4890 domain-containing protein n=1 Tax=Dyadobacter jejuensis TaxID=1082580 RepID=A0A316AL14_9BACT|nr:hypothetical protein [Dyadobacter jejuensis]PWJ58463.1 hypothetical protein CLV98_104323 [Dyadobacter jejuensis]
MKKGLMIIMLAMASMTAFAQRPNNSGTAEERAEAQTKRMTESLKLSEDQQKQVYALTLDRMQSMEEMRKSQSMDRDKMKASNEAYQAKMNEILTPEQQEQLKTMNSDRQGQGGGRKGKPRS